MILGEKSERRDQSSFSFLENINFWKSLPRAPQSEYPPLVIVNEHLSWKEHNMLIYKKLRQIFCITVKIKPNLNEKTLLMLHHSLFMSHIRYCISSWCFGNKTLIDKLQRLCNKFKRITFNLSHRENVSRTLLEYNLITIKHMYKVEIGCWKQKHDPFYLFMLSCDHVVH